MSWHGKQITAPWRSEQQASKAANIKKLVIEPVASNEVPVATLLRSRHRPAGPTLSDRLSTRRRETPQEDFEQIEDDLEEVQPRNIIERRSLRIEKEKERERERDAANPTGDDVIDVNEEDGMNDSAEHNDDDEASNQTNDANDTTTIGDDELAAAGGDEADSVPVPTEEVAQPEPQRKPRDGRIVSYSEVYRNALMSRRRVSLGDNQAMSTTLPRVSGTPEEPTATEENDPVPPSPYPTLTREDAYVQPDLSELQNLPEERLRAVEGFIYGIRGIGEVEWLQAVDLTGVDLDSVVKIVHREVSVYPTDRGLTVPPPGTGLNTQAIVRLHGIWKHDKRTKQPMRDASATAQIVARLKRHCDSEGLTFLGYEVRTGTWTFRTEHF